MFKDAFGVDINIDDVVVVSTERGFRRGMVIKLQSRKKRDKTINSITIQYTQPKTSYGIGVFRTNKNIIVAQKG